MLRSTALLLRYCQRGCFHQWGLGETCRSLSSSGRKPWKRTLLPKFGGELHFWDIRTSSAGRGRGWVPSAASSCGRWAPGIALSSRAASSPDSWQQLPVEPSALLLVMWLWCKGTKREIKSSVRRYLKRRSRTAYSDCCLTALTFSILVWFNSELLT